MVNRTHPHPFICLAGVLLAVQLSACTSWRVQNISPQQLVSRDSTQRVRIVRLNGAQVTIKGARLRGDTLYGSPTPIAKRMPDTLVAIPLSDVRAIEVRQGDTGKTVGLVLGVSALVAGAVFVAFLSALGQAGY
jgi:hypothetical protein